MKLSPKIKRGLTHLLESLREPSAWRGIVYLLSGAGVALQPEHGEAIIALGMVVAGAIAVAFKDSRHGTP